jgi:hypothetical protein
MIRSPGERRARTRAFFFAALAPASLASLAALSPSVARAEPSGATPVSNEMRAEQLFQLAEKEFDSGRFNEACRDFGASLRAGPKLGTLLNLALCDETIGKIATAWQEFHFAAALAAQKGERDRHEYASQHAAALEGRLPRVLFQLPAGISIATIDVDREPLPDSRWYLPLFLDPGEHEVAITAPGKQPSSVKFTVIAAPTDQIVAIPPLAGVEPTPRAGGASLEDPARARARTAGFIVLGGGLAALAVGAGFGAFAISARDAAGTHCSGKYCDPSGADHYERAQTLATISTIAMAGGALAAAVGAYFVLANPPAPTRTASGAPGSLGLSIGPRAGGGEVGLGATF